MKHSLITLIAAATLAMPSLASAAPFLTSDGRLGTTLLGPFYSDTGAELVNMTDVDGTRDTSTSLLLKNLGGFVDGDTFGIFDPFSGTKIEIFEGDDAEGEDVTLEWKDTGLYRNGALYTSAPFGYTFGFYLTGGSNTLYSTRLHNGGPEPFLIFDVKDQSGYFGSDVVVAVDGELMVGVDDVAPVPEPGSMLLFGTGLLGLAGAARRKFGRRGER